MNIKIIKSNHRKTINETIEYLVLLRNEIQESRDKNMNPLYIKTANQKLFELRDLIDRLDEIVRV